MDETPLALSQNEDAEFEELLDRLFGDVIVDSNDAQSDGQLENFERAEDQERSHIITSILRRYRAAYQSKVKFQRWCRYVLFGGCVVLIAVLSWTIVWAVRSTISSAELDLSHVSTIITALVSFAALIMKLVETITSYCFPENDEQYIVDIIKSIQQNDLERKKERNRAAEAKGNRKKD